MGYESLEKDSLLTLKFALRVALGASNKGSQIQKDIKYELQRIERELEL